MPYNGLLLRNEVGRHLIFSVLLLHRAAIMIVLRQVIVHLKTVQIVIGRVWHLLNELRD